MKKIKQNIVQINNNELQKCKLGQEFKVDVITHVKSKSTPPVPPNGGNGGGRGGDGVHKPRKAPDWFHSFEERNNSRLDRIEAILEEHTVLLKTHGERLDNIDTRLNALDHKVDRVITLNNLKN
jgi:hypothetical protein